ncbi:hypothetical protein GW590_08375 [Rahnella sp. SAP-1]|jgi:hypothetical protein|uniref:Uncharacterized protein n=1 Tax=Rouxiella aceris TaxID=2703884 RepID=A0A848MF23_9GAMM|nr:hypothetical protein [Rouxiella aceris]NMP26878.1 hypothetical protein [Rouxiella aceris]
MTKLTSAQLVKVMLGKRMNYMQIVEEAAAQFPDCEINIASIQTSVRSMILSPHVDIERFNGRKVSYELKRVDEKFLRISATRSRMPKNGSGLKRVGFDPKELECCELATRFNQLLMPVRQRYTREGHQA